MFCYFRLQIFEQAIKDPPAYRHELFIKTKHISEKLVTEDEITENLKGFNFADHCGQDNGRISHPLHITDIGSQQMKTLKNLLNLLTQYFLTFKVCPKTKRSIEIFFYLSRYVTVYHSPVPSFLQLGIKLESEAQLIMENNRPDSAALLIRNEFFYQCKCSFPKLSQIMIFIFIGLKCFQPMLALRLFFN